MNSHYSSGENLTVSVAKGICILLVVIGHSGCPEVLCRFIYLFHVPFFFFISGYFNKAADSLVDLKMRLLKRVKRLYLPFIIYGSFFLLLDALLIRVGPERDFAALFTDWLLMIVKMNPPSDLLGGFWFIRTLFFAGICVDVSLFLFKRWSFGALLLLFCGITLILKLFPAGTPIVRQLVLVVMAVVFLLLGMIYKVHELGITHFVHRGGYYYFSLH